MPILAQGLLALAIVALGVTVLWVGSGGIGPLLTGLASGFEGVFTTAAASGSPSPGPPKPVSDAPSIVAPVQPYTNLETVDVRVKVPGRIVGEDGYTVRLTAAAKDAAPSVVAEAPVGPTSVVLFTGIGLLPGRNEFTATVVGPGTESAPSEVAAWVLDQVPPRITIASPNEGAVVNKDALTIEGKTQGRATVVARNEANGATGTTQATPDGVFSLTVSIASGINGITLTATDEAGNSNTAILSVRKGSGKLSASLTASAYRFSAKNLPQDVVFSVTVLDPDGRPLAGATALFTILVPGLEPVISSELTTGGDGTAVFRTRIPKGAQAGPGGLASVLVDAGSLGRVTDRAVLTVGS